MTLPNDPFEILLTLAGLALLALLMEVALRYLPPLEDDGDPDWHDYDAWP